jgi:hypothetical protein
VPPLARAEPNGCLTGSRPPLALGADAQGEEDQDDNDILSDNLKCAICMDACDRPVTVSGALPAQSLGPGSASGRTRDLLGRPLPARRRRCPRPASALRPRRAPPLLTGMHPSSPPPPPSHRTPPGALPAQLLPQVLQQVDRHPAQGELPHLQGQPACQVLPEPAHQRRAGGGHQVRGRPDSCQARGRLACARPLLAGGGQGGGQGRAKGGRAPGLLRRSRLLDPLVIPPARSAPP